MKEKLQSCLQKTIHDKRNKQNIAYRQLTITSYTAKLDNCDWDVLLLLLLSSPNNSNNYKTYYQSGMGEPDIYNGDFARPVHIVAAPFRDVAIGK